DHPCGSRQEAFPQHPGIRTAKRPEGRSTSTGFSPQSESRTWADPSAEQAEDSPRACLRRARSRLEALRSGLI
ncbi:unnamed protein product, partial [Polarella glacialis]